MLQELSSGAPAEEENIRLVVNELLFPLYPLIFHPLEMCETSRTQSGLIPKSSDASLSWQFMFASFPRDGPK
jgi:hypothetical protein